MNQFSAKAFQRKIDAFCQLRLAPLFKDDELPRLKWYLHTLIQTRRPAPRTSGRTDWHAVAAACGLDTHLLAGNARQIDPACDAIGRWIRDTRLVAAAADPEVRQTLKTPRTKAVPRRPRPARATQNQPKPASGATAASTGTNLEFPEALFDVREDPTELSEALQL